MGRVFNRINLFPFHPVSTFVRCGSTLIPIILLAACATHQQDRSFTDDKLKVEREAEALPADMKKAEALGFAFDPAKFDRHVPNSENAEPLYAAAEKVLKESGVELPTGIGLPPDENSFMQKCAFALACIDEACSRPFYDVHTSFVHGVPWPHFENYAVLKLEAKVLAAHAQISAKRGDYARMARDYEDIGRMIGHLSQDPTIIAQLVAVAIGAIAFRSTERTASLLSAKKYALSWLESAIKTFPARLDFSSALCGEARMQYGFLGYIGREARKTKGKGVWTEELSGFTAGSGEKPTPETVQQARELDSMNLQAVIAAFRARSIESWNQICSALAAPGASYATRRTAFQDEERHQNSADITNFFIRNIGPNIFTQAYLIAVTYEAQKDVAIQGIKIIEEHAETGKWPAASPKAAIDPFTCKGLIFRRKPNGFIVYSVGPNMRDDGGVPKPKADDVVFQYPSTSGTNSNVLGAGR